MSTALPPWGDTWDSFKDHMAELANGFWQESEPYTWYLIIVEQFKRDEDGDYFLIFEHDIGKKYRQAFYDSIEDELRDSIGISSHKGGEEVWRETLD